jgi:hypothetical protein
MAEVVTVGVEGSEASGTGTVTPADTPVPVSAFALTESPFASTETDGDDEPDDPDPDEPEVDDPGPEAGVAGVGVGDSGGVYGAGPGGAGLGSLPDSRLLPPVLPGGTLDRPSRAWPSLAATDGTATPTETPWVKEWPDPADDDVATEVGRVEAVSTGPLAGALSCKAPGTNNSQPRSTRLGSESLAIPASATIPRIATQPVKTDRRDTHERAAGPTAGDSNIVQHLRRRFVTTTTRSVSGVIGQASGSEIPVPRDGREP